MKFFPKNLRALLIAAILFGCAKCPIAFAAPLAGQRVLWLGDSITQAGDYVTFTEYYLERIYPKESFDIINIGRNSETASGLSEKTHPGPRPWILDRLPRALASAKPGIVVSCYGMNDGIYHPESPELLKAFQDGTKKLIDLCHAAGAKVILLTPPPFDRLPVKNLLPKDAPDFSYRNSYENYDDVLASFAKWEMTLPATDAQTIDLHTPMNDYLAKQRLSVTNFSFVSDGIHPNAAGHLLMAQIILRGLGVTLPDSAADLTQELARIQADPVYPLIKRQREKRSDAWLNHAGNPETIASAEDENAKLQSQIDALRAP